MIPDAFHDRSSPGIPHAETLASTSVGKEMTTRRTIHDGVAENGILRCFETAIRRWLDPDLAAGHTFADVVVCFSSQGQTDPSAKKRGERLSRTSRQLNVDGTFGKAMIAPALSHDSGEFRADIPVGVFHFVGQRSRFLLLDLVTEVFQDLVVERRLMQSIVAIAQADPWKILPRCGADVVENPTEIDQVGLRMIRQFPLTEIGGVPDQIIEFADTESRHVFADFLRHGVEEIHDVLHLALELGAVLWILRSHSHRAVVEVASANVDTAHCDQCDRSEVVFLGSEGCRVDDILPGSHPAIRPQRDPIAKTIHHQNLLRLRNPDLPGETRVLDRAQWGSTRASVMTRHENDVGIGLGDTRSDRSHSGFGDQLDRYLGGRVDFLEIVNELSQVLDRVNIVVRRRRNQGNPRLRISQLCNEPVDLVTGQLPTLTGLRTLRHLDLDLLCGHQVFRADSEAPRGDLLDLGISPVPIRIRSETPGIFSPFATVGLSTDAVHRDGERLVSFRTDRTKRHRCRRKPTAHVLDGLDFLDGDRPLVIGNQFEKVVKGVRLIQLQLLEIPVVVVGFATPDEGMEILDDATTDGVSFPIATEAKETRIPEFQLSFFIGNRVIVRRGVSSDTLCCDLVKSDAGNLGRSAGETAIDDTVGDSNRLEDLGTLVAVEDRDPHLRHDLEDPFFQRLVIIHKRLLNGNPFELVLRIFLNQFVDRFMSEPGTDRCRSEADQASHMVGIPCLRRIDYDTGFHPLLRRSEMTVNGTHGKKCGNPDSLMTDRSVGQNQGLGTGIDGGFSTIA